MAKMKLDLKKEAVWAAEAFRRFARSGYKRSLFTQRLYGMMCQSFGFIAHFDRDGFYSERFSQPGRRMGTLVRMVERTPWPATVAEHALREVVLAEDLLDMSTAEGAILREEACTDDAERSDMRELGRLMARLKKKYPNVISLHWTRVKTGARRVGA